MTFPNIRIADEVVTLPVEFTTEFEYVGFLGRGADGVALTVREKSTRELLCSKISSLKRLDPEAHKRQHRELRLLVDLTKPPNKQEVSSGGWTYIVKLRKHYMSKTCRVLVTELGNAGTLTDALEGLKAYPGDIRERIARRWMGQLVRAMHFLEVRRVIHRDLKPDNVVLNCSELVDGSAAARLRRTDVRLIDFGYSKNIQVDPTTSVVAGTIKYMAPERLINRTTDTQLKCSAEIWSLGALAYEIVTGTLYFDVINGEVTPDGSHVNLRGTPTYPPSVSREFADFVSRCCQLNPEHRWTAGQLVHHPWISPFYGEAARTAVEGTTAEPIPEADPERDERLAVIASGPMRHAARAEPVAITIPVANPAVRTPVRTEPSPVAAVAVSPVATPAQPPAAASPQRPPATTPTPTPPAPTGPRMPPIDFRPVVVPPVAPPAVIEDDTPPVSDEEMRSILAERERYQLSLRRRAPCQCLGANWGHHRPGCVNK